MASLTKLNGGSWRIWWRESGKRKSIVVKTKRLADIELARLALLEACSKPIRAGAVLDLPELIIRWERARVDAGKDPVHMEAAGKRLRALIKREGWSRPDDVTPSEVERFRIKGCARSGAMLQGVLQWAFVVHNQPVHQRSLKLLSPGGRPRAPKRALLTDEAVSRLLAKARTLSEGCHAVLHCLSTYGWRPITAARLTVGDLDLVAGKVTTSVKGGDTVRHPLMEETLRLLRPLASFRAHDAPLFLDPRTGLGWDVIGAESIPIWFRDHVTARGSGIGVYDLKRYAITSMLRRGLRREQVAVFTGHRTLSVIDTYTLQNDETQAEALAALTATRQPLMDSSCAKVCR